MNERAWLPQEPSLALRGQLLLQRAGAWGAWHGGDAGSRAVGVQVPVKAARDLRQVLDQTTPVTLLLSGAADYAELVPQAAAGHEIAGAGPIREWPLLSVLAGRPVQHWSAHGNAPALWRTGVRPLPLPGNRPTPGGTLEVQPEDLTQALQEMRALGYQPGPVGALKLRAATPRDLFEHLYGEWMEDSYARRIGAIDLSQRFDGVLKVAPLDHAPPPLPLPFNTPTAELHLHSRKLVGLASHSPLTAYRAATRSLRDVAHALQTRPELATAQAVFAVSLFAGLLEKSGFELVELPPAQAAWYGLGFRLLRLAYGTARTPSQDKPRLAWMPREAFLGRFG